MGETEIYTRGEIQERAIDLAKRVTQLEKIYSHTFVPDNIGEAEQASRFCKVCGLYLSDNLHYRANPKPIKHTESN